MLDEGLLEILACPSCRADVLYDEQREQIVCAGCHLRYPIRDGIPIMLVDEARKDPCDADH